MSLQPQQFVLKIGLFFQFDWPFLSLLHSQGVAFVIMINFRFNESFSSQFPELQNISAWNILCNTSRCSSQFFGSGCVIGRRELHFSRLCLTT